MSIVIIFILVVDSFHYSCLNFWLVLVFSVFYFQFSFPFQSVPECRHQKSNPRWYMQDLIWELYLIVHFTQSTVSYYIKRYDFSIWTKFPRLCKFLFTEACMSLLNTVWAKILVVGIIGFLDALQRPSLPAWCNTIIRALYIIVYGSKITTNFFLGNKKKYVILLLYIW